MTAGNGEKINFTYDARKRLQNKAVVCDSTTVLTDAYAYKDGKTAGTTTSMVEYHNVRDRSGNIISGAKYDYDELGNIKGIYESVLAQGTVLCVET